jgi:alkylation response protein AidB-like acyl-CoA dehydrogenase
MPPSIPDNSSLDSLCKQLRAGADALDADGHWPAEQLRLCAEHGVFRWFLPKEWGGWDWSDVDCIRGYLRLSAACLTTTFVITQRTGACRRIADSDNQRMKQRWLAPLADGRQILVALPTDAPGVRAAPPAQLVGLSASHTGAVRCDNVYVPNEWLLAGPVENVMSQGTGAGTGGLQTSTLALGLASAAIEYLAVQGKQRTDLVPPAESLEAEWQAAVDDLFAAADGSPTCSSETLRSRANALALRASQAALTAAKGAGYVAGHPTGRWCREAMFFLVWSCPQPVLNATICELAGLG